MLSRTGDNYIGIGLVQFNASNILANGFTPMATYLNMSRHKIIYVREPLAGSEVATKDYVDRS
jgi:hypothetical protein